MVKRRKVLIGAGSLIAGSAAAVGTGAYSAAEVRDREIEADIVGDQNGLVKLSPGEDPAGNYLRYDNGKILFDADADYPGTGLGLNKDATFYYDSALAINIGDDDLGSAYKDKQVEEEYEITIDDSGAPGVRFYVGQTRDTGAGVNDALWATKAKTGQYEPFYAGFRVNSAQINQPDVGSITIELEGVGQGGDV
jgi:hypothetical protein